SSIKGIGSFYIILFTLIFITFTNPEIMHNFISFIGSIIPESVYQYFVNVRVGKVLVFDTLKLFLTIQVILFTYLVISYLINIIFNKELFKKLVVKRLFDGVLYLASKKCMKWHLKMYATYQLKLLL